MSIEYIVKSASSKYSNLRLGSIDNLNSVKYVTVYGGLNGHGKMRDYLSDIIDLIDNFEENFNEVVVNKLEFDMLDDLFVIEIIANDPIKND